jgi:hypothetical protein
MSSAVQIYGKEESKQTTGKPPGGALPPSASASRPGTSAGQRGATPPRNSHAWGRASSALRERGAAGAPSRPATAKSGGSAAPWLERAGRMLSLCRAPRAAHAAACEDVLSSTQPVRRPAPWACPLRVCTERGATFNRPSTALQPLRVHFHVAAPQRGTGPPAPGRANATAMAAAAAVAPAQRGPTASPCPSCSSCSCARTARWDPGPNPGPLLLGRALACVVKAWRKADSGTGVTCVSKEPCLLCGSLPRAPRLAGYPRAHPAGWARGDLPARQLHRGRGELHSGGSMRVHSIARLRPDVCDQWLGASECQVVRAFAQGAPTFARTRRTWRTLNLWTPCA